MKMLTLVCGERIEDEVLLLFNDLQIAGYTVVSNVGGSGQTGSVSGTGGWKDRSKMYFIALEDGRAIPIANAMRDLHVRLIQDYHGHEVPLKVFIQPCEVVV
jgi:hypothetical protein